MSTDNRSKFQIILRNLLRVLEFVGFGNLIRKAGWFDVGLILFSGRDDLRLVEVSGQKI